MLAENSCTGQLKTEVQLTRFIIIMSTLLNNVDIIKSSESAM